MIKIFLTNLGKYTEGISPLACGKWVDLPCDDLMRELEEINVKNDTEYEEYFISDYETDIPEFEIGEHANLDSLNDTATLYDELAESEQLLVQMIMESGERSELQEAIADRDKFSLTAGITDEDEAGQELLDLYELPENLDFLRGYIDYEAYYRDCNQNRGCTLCSKGLLHIYG